MYVLLLEVLEDLGIVSYELRIRLNDSELANGNVCCFSGACSADMQESVPLASPQTPSHSQEYRRRWRSWRVSPAGSLAQSTSS